MGAENFDAGFDLEKSYNESFKDLKENTIVTASVIDISADTVFLDLGYKSEAKVLKTEFDKVPNIGDEVEIFLVRLEGRNGDPVVSKKRCDQIKERIEIEKSIKDEEVLEGRVLEVQKNGFAVKYKALTGFIPFSIFDVRRINNPEEFKGKTIKFYIEKLTNKRPVRKGEVASEFIGNRKKYIKEENKIKKQQFFEERQVGEVVEGVVKNITDFGAFVDLGSVEALLHIKEISWVRVENVSDILKIGDNVKVKILNLDAEKGKVAVGLKQTEEEPWDKFIKQYNQDDVVVGTVSSIVSYGAFVKIIDGVEGLLHISDMSWTKNVKNPAELLSKGQQAEVKIIGIDMEKKKINLSLKHLLENPWDSVDAKYTVGTKVKAKIKTITSFGLFVELEEGVEALLHKDEVSWTERINDTFEYFKDKEGTEIDVVIISLDKDNKRIKAGIKQLSDDPWQELVNTAKKNAALECEIISFDDEKGALVKVADNVETYIPYNEFEKGRPEEVKGEVKSRYNVGEKINVIVQNFDLKKRILNLSVKDFFIMEESKKVKEFLHDHKEDGKFTLEDMMKSKNED